VNGLTAYLQGRRWHCRADTARVWWWGPECFHSGESDQRRDRTTLEDQRVGEHPDHLRPGCARWNLRRWRRDTRRRPESPTLSTAHRRTATTVKHGTIYNIVNCGLLCSHWGGGKTPCHPCVRPEWNHHFYCDDLDSTNALERWWSLRIILLVKALHQILVHYSKPTRRLLFITSAKKFMFIGISLLVYLGITQNSVERYGKWATEEIIRFGGNSDHGTPG